MRASVIVTLVFLAGCRKLPLEGKITGYKPGSETVVLLHVKSNSGAYVQCMPDGLACGSVSMGARGETDIELTPGSDPSKKQVVLYAKHGPRSNTVIVPLDAKALPPKVTVDTNASFRCTMRECTGALELVPAGRASMKTEPGTVLEIGNARATADAQGDIDTPIDVQTTPPLRSLSLKTLCATKESTVGSVAIALTFPDKKKATTQASFTTEHVLRGLVSGFAGVTTAPVFFSWEKGAAPTLAKNRRSALYLDGGSCGTGGPVDATLAEVTVIALGKEQPRVDPVGCVYNLTDKNDKDKGVAKGKLTLHDVQATAYDRLTGKTLGTKLFQPERSCISALTLKGNESILNQNAYVDRDAVAAWAARLAP